MSPETIEKIFMYCVTSGTHAEQIVKVIEQMKMGRKLTVEQYELILLGELYSEMKELCDSSKKANLP